jgi:hypothetical protein
MTSSSNLSLLVLHPVQLGREDCLLLFTEDTLHYSPGISQAFEAG